MGTQCGRSIRRWHVTSLLRKEAGVTFWGSTGSPRWTWLWFSLLSPTWSGSSASLASALAVRGRHNSRR